MITTAQTALAQHRITRLASQIAVHRAFHWLHLHEHQLRLWQLEMLAIPAPPFAESARAAWFLERFTALGLSNVHLDSEGNAFGELVCHPSRSGGSASAPSALPAPSPVLLLSAHLDTVFPPGTPTTPRHDGTRILAPGACDNAAGLTALLALIAAFRHAWIAPPVTLLFAANVGEEGEGNLRGMRHLFLQGPYAGRIAAAIALEGAGTSAAVDRALGSRRFRVTVSGPGGHSWTDASAPNPITLIARALTTLTADTPGSPSQTVSPSEVGSKNAPTTTFSPGLISGGTSINSIPASASVSLDLRSTDPAALDLHSEKIRQIFESLILPPAALLIEPIGDRPAATLPPDAPLLDTLRAVDRHLGLRTELRLGSTDANIPLSLGIPALALASGGTGGGIHTLAEWYDPTGRETALRRILLVTLDVAQSLLP